MTGKILGFDAENNVWKILGDDRKRYSFSKKDWKERIKPEKEALVEFNIAENYLATDVYQTSDKTEKSYDKSDIETVKNTNQPDMNMTKDNDMLIGLLAVVLTFFLGFIGTFISRLVLAKQPVGKTIVPTLIHFIFNITIIVPILGWILYFASTLFYMYKNYKLVTVDSKV